MKKAVISNLRLLTCGTVLGISALMARAQSPFFQAVTNLNPAAYWPLQEAVQPPASDVETNYGSLGIVANAYYSSTNVVKGQTGVTTGDGDTSLEVLDQNGSWLGVPNADNRISLPQGPFSVEAWIEPNGTATGNSPYTIASQTGVIGSGGLNGTTNASGWVLVQNYDYGQSNGNFQGWSFHVYNGVGATGGADALVVSNYTTKNWYHLVGVYDGTNAYLYVDGVNNSISTSTGGSYSRDTWDPLIIGSAWQNTRGYQGWLDEVAIYTNALTAGQVQNHYSNVGSSTYAGIITNTDNAYMYWRMDAPAYVTPDASTLPTALNYGNVANVNGLYLTGTKPGVAGPALPGMFDPNNGNQSLAVAISAIGTSSSNAVAIFTNGVFYTINKNSSTGIIITNLPNVLNPVTNSFSLMTWFKCNPIDNRRNALFGHSDNGWRTSLNPSGGATTLTANSGKGSDLATSGPGYNDGNWHFAVIVYTNTGVVGPGGYGWQATNYIYVDGQLMASALDTNANASGSFTNIMIGDAPDKDLTGNGNVYLNQLLMGSLAHVAFFTNALSPIQIINLYTNATGGTPPSAPVITSQPFPYPAVRVVDAGPAGPGTNYIFEAVVASGGTPNLSYQWYYNTSSNFAGATALVDNGTQYQFSATSQLTVTNLTGADSGYYFCVVDNSYGAVTSAIVNVQVYTNPVITAQSPVGPFNLYPNQKLTLSVTAASGVPATYQWFTNGVADGSAAGTTAGYAITAGTSPAFSGSTYQCVVNNSYGSTTGAIATLTVTPLPASLANSAYSTNILGLQPSGYWPMHETTGPSYGPIETNYGSLGNLANGYYSDWSTNATASPLVKHVPGALVGTSDTAVDFNINVAANAGGPNYLLVPHSSPASTLTAPFSIECWFNPQNANFGDLLSQWGEAVNNSAARYGFRLIWAGNFEAGFGDGASSYHVITGQSHANDQWYHVVATLDASTNLTLYVNGNQEASAFPFTAGPVTLGDPSLPLVIGSGFWGSGGTARPVDGAIDEVAVYTNALSLARVQAHYSSAVDPVDNGAYFTNVLADAPTIYLRMDAPPYTPPPVNTWAVVTNYGSVPVNGVYSPGTIVGGAAGPGNAIGFVHNLSGTNAMLGSGMSSFADLGNNAAYNPVGSTAFSFSAWYKCNPVDSRTWNSIMGRSDSSIHAAINSTGKQLGHGGTNDITSSTVYNDGNWHSFVVTYTGTNTTYNSTNTGVYGISTLYVDGQSVGQTVGGANAGSALDLMVGNDPQYTNNPLGPGRCFAGNICEASFFTGTALSSNQVKSLYDSAGMPPSISTQPVSATVNAGIAFTNVVAAAGSGVLSYQWYRNGQPLPVAGQTNLTAGGTNAALIINPVSGSDASADYYVVVSGAFGSLTSSIVSLSVFTQPQFTFEPVLETQTNNILLFANATPTFSVSTVGAQPVYYQWFTNGVAATPFGVGNTNYTLPPVQVGGAGVTSFYCVATNFVGRTTDTTVGVIGIPAPTAAYPVTVLGDHPVSLWRLNEPNVDNLNDGTIADDYWGGKNGIYTNTILGQTGYDTAEPSETAALFGANSFLDNDAYGINGVDFGAPTNTSVTFSIEAWVNGVTQSSDAGIISKGYGGGGEEYVLDTGSDAGTPQHAFRFFVRDAAGNTHIANSSIYPAQGSWYHLVGICDEVNGAVTLYINGAIAAIAPITPGSGILPSTRSTIIGSRPSNATTNHNNMNFAGDVADVAIYNYALSAGQIDTHYAQAGVPPYFTQLPAAIIVTNGFASLTIPATLVGTPPISFQWADVSGGTNIITGSTNGTVLLANLTIGSVPLTWNGDTLQLTVNNAYGSTNISVALTVNTNAPVFTLNLPAQVTVVSGRSYTYAPIEVGPQPYNYQWYANNLPISGQNGSTLSQTGGPVGASEDIFVIVGNAFGSVTSTVSLFTSIGTNTYEDSVVTLNPVGYWPLQETVAPAPATIETNYGTLGALGNAYYAFTNDVNGVQDGTATLAQGGATSDGDNSVSFSGAPTSLAFVPRATPLLTIKPPLSLECWVNSSSTAFSDLFGESGAGLDAPANGGNWGGVRLSYGGNDAGGPNLQFYVCNGNGATRNAVSTAANTLPAGQWHHCVATYDGTNTVLYIDGALSVADSTTLAGGNTENPDTWTPFSLGGSFWQTNGGVLLPIRSYSGLLDEVAVYTNILNAGQVSAHYAAASGGSYLATIEADRPLLYYRMDCQSYTNPPPTLFPVAVNYGTAPVSGDYQSGIVPGGVSGPSIPGLTNGVAAPGNGVFACVDGNSDPSFNPTGTNAFSAMVWVRCYPADPRVQTIISHGVTNWAMNLDGTTGRIVWNTGSGGNVTSTNVLNDGLWHFVAGVQDGRTNTLYVDGVVNSRAALAGSGLTGEPGAHLYIGGNQDFVSVLNNVRYLNGAIAEAAVFTNALSITQIQGLYGLLTVNPTISMTITNGQIVINYTGTLLSSTNVAGPYQPVAGASSPYTVTPAGAQSFYRTSSP